jgi:ribosome-associated protein
VTADARALELARAAALAADSIKATDITALDVTGRMPLTDAFVLATGLSERQVNGIVDAVEEHLLGLGAKPIRREGRNGARWVLLDYGEIVVHVLHAEDRDFYALEKLWKDCPRIDLPGVGIDHPMAVAVGE